MHANAVYLMVSTQWIGIIAGVLTSISLLPQLIKLIREKEADELSLAWLFILLAGLGLWAYYGTLKDDWPIIITNSFSVVVTATLIFFKLKYSK